MAFTETVGNISSVNTTFGVEHRRFPGLGLTATGSLSKTDRLDEFLMEKEADTGSRIPFGSIEADLRDVGVGVLALHGPNSHGEWALVEDRSPQSRRSVD